MPTRITITIAWAGPTSNIVTVPVFWRKARIRPGQSQPNGSAARRRRPAERRPMIKSQPVLRKGRLVFDAGWPQNGDCLLRITGRHQNFIGGFGEGRTHPAPSGPEPPRQRPGPV